MVRRMGQICVPLILVGIEWTQAQNGRLFVRLSAASITPAGGYACAIKGSAGASADQGLRSASPYVLHIHSHGRTRRTSSFATDRRLSSNLTEECRVDGDVFDCSGHRLDAKFVLLEKPAQTVAVDEVNRRCAIASCFFLGVASE
jgi:hypothetical protein